MFSLTDLEDKLLRPISAQIAFLFMAGLLGYELISDAIQYHQIHSRLTQISLQPRERPHKIVKQTLMQKNLRQPIFGDYIPKALVDLNIKPSGLNLILVGIVFSTDKPASASQAMISIPGGQTQIFYNGSILPGGAKIKQITPDGILLEHEGELESMSLPKNELIFEPAPKPLEQGS